MKPNSAFFQTLIHELNAPLNAVDGYLYMMKEKQCGNQISDYEFQIKRSEERILEMKALITKVLEYSFSQNSSSSISDFELTAIVQNASETIQSLLKQKNVQIFIHSNKKVNLNADVSDFEIIFNNLLSNAAKYNRPNGSIQVDLKEHTYKLEITVADTGIGMSEDEKQIVFDEFVRIKNHRTKDISGHGLGLSIVKNIVDSYRGTIEINSVQNEGTKILITIPLPANKEK